MVKYDKTIREMYRYSFNHDNLLYFFFNAKHEKPSATNPSDDTMCTTIKRFLLPVGVLDPVNCLLDILVRQSPAFTHVLSK